jgi:hypothetical protein
MAVEPDYLGNTPPAPPTEESGSLLLDAAKTFGKRALDVQGAVTGGIADVIGSQPGEPTREVQKLFHAASDAVEDTISPANRSWRDSAAFPEEGQKSMFASPGKAAVMKLASMGPDILGAFLLPPGWAGVAAGSAFYGTLGVAEQLDRSRKKIDSLPDDVLQKQSFIYKNLRTEMGEAEAREKLIKGMDDPTSLAMTGAGNAIGGGTMAHALRGTAGRSLLGGIGVGVADGLVGGAAGGAGQEGASQRADIRGGFKPEYDPDRMALAILNSSVEGGFLGGAFGAVGSVGSRRDRIRDRANGTEVPPGAPDPAQTAALVTDNEPDSTRTPSPPEVTPPAAGAATGTLAQQIEAERARQAAEATPPAAGAPPVVPPTDITKPPGSEPGIPPMPRGVVPPPPAAGPRVPNPRTEQLVPPPPTDTMLAPGRRKAPAERTAVPLEEEVVAPPRVTAEPEIPLPPAEGAPLRAAEVQAAVREMPQKAAEPPPSPRPTEAPAPAPEKPAPKEAPEVPRGMPKGSTYLGDNANGEAVWQYPEGGPRASRGADKVLRVMAVGDEVIPPRFEVVGEKKAELTYPEPLAPTGKAEEPDAPVAQDRLVADKAAPAKLVSAEAGKPRVFRVENTWAKQQEQERKARQEELATERKNAAEAKRKVVARKENKTTPNENKAREYITGRHPKSVEDITRVGTVESNALKGDEAAQREVVQSAVKLVADAKEAGVEIPQRTTRGANTNPTPYTSHLIETVRFLKAVKDAANLKTESKRKAAIADAFTNYITAERALRSGDLQAAAARRIAANEAANAGSTRAKNENATRAEGEQADAETARKKLGDEKDPDDTDTDADSTPLSDVAPARKLTEAEELDALIKEQSDDAAREKATAKKKSADEADDTKTDALDDVAARDDADVDLADQRDESYSQRMVGSKRAPTQRRKTTVRDELEPYLQRYENSDKPLPRLAVAIIRKVIDRVGDTPIEVMSLDEYNTMRVAAGLDVLNKDVEGIFGYNYGGLQANGTRGTIRLFPEMYDTVAGGPLRVTLHEAVHAATAHALRNDPKLFNQVNLMMAWVKLKTRNTNLSERVGSEYGMRDMDPLEFVAEAMANPSFQKLLSEIEVPASVARAWGIEPKATSVWKALVEKVVDFLKLPFPKAQSMTMLDAILRKSDDMFAYEPKAAKGRDADGMLAYSERTDRMKAEVVDFTREAPRTLRTKLRGLGLKLGTVIQIGESANRLFGPDNLGTRLSNLLGKAATEKERILNSGDRQLVGDMAALQRKTSPEAWNDFSRFLLDETMAGVFADAPVPKGESVALWQGRAQHADLQRRLNELPPDLRAMRKRMHDYFRERQNDISKDLIKNIVRVINDGVPDDALAMKIFENKLDPAEKAILEKDAVFKAIRDARAMSKIKGPYVPLMREGDHVVSGRFTITSPGNATRVDAAGKPDDNSNIFEFKTKAEAKSFAENQTLKVLKTQRVFTDPATGERFVEITTADGTEKYKLTASDAAWGVADEKFRVTVQDKYLAFFEREVHARQHHAEMSARNDVVMDGVAPRRWEPHGANSSFMSEAFNQALNSLQQRKGFQELDAGAKRQLVDHLRNASLAAMGSTRAQSRRLPRTFVAGASTDITSTTGKYASSSAGYLSRARFQPQIDATLKAMTDYNNDYGYEATERTYPRGQILKELKERVYRQGDPEPTGMWHQASSRLLQLSFLDKLASPAFHMINAAEPWTISMPLLAGRFKVGRTMAALNQAYRDIGAMSAAGAGLSDTVKAFKTDQGLTNYLTRFQDRLRKLPDGKHIADMLEHLYDVGLLSRDAGMELGRMSTPNSPLVGRALDRADLMARQVGTAIESINRTVTAVAAYRLEYAKTKDHARAKAYAQEITHDAMGDYSSWNAAPIFNHGLGRLALQFKKYAQKTYFLLGKTAAAALRGDKEAMKAFAGIMATHATLAGTLGLPIEAIKVGFITANLLGMTNSGYDDFERWTRELAASSLGVAGGQIVTRGLPRYLGVDLSGRFGLESMIFPMGEPKSRKPEDLLAYAAKAFAGAPISMLTEYPAGVKALWEGDVALAMEKLVPLKVWADSMQAYQKYEKGKQTPSGRETLSPYSPGEAALKVLGFTPGREAETGEMRGSLMKQQQQEREERTKLITKWVQATPAEKSAMWVKIREWNAGQPKGARLEMKELTDNQQRRIRETKDSNNEFGFRTSTRDAHIREGVQYYNVR